MNSQMSDTSYIVLVANCFFGNKILVRDYQIIAWAINESGI